MPPSPNKKHWLGKGWLSVLSLGLSVALISLVAINRQPITDWLRLLDYQPPSAISQLADQDTMTPYARHLFYLNKPELLSSVSSFRQHCSENENTIVLGCYHPEQDGIYIYNVQDPELQGVSQVTAAHENLHAIYDRLSDSQRQYVDGLLQDYYQNGLTDQRVKDEIGLYKKTEPKSLLNEMHSIFGTEIADLPPALEEYYNQYFSNRSAIVAFSKRYEQAFTARQNRISQDDRQLSAMKRQIDTQQAALQAQQSRLSSAQRRLKALLSTGQNTEYNAQIPAYNSQVNDYNNSVESLRSLIDSYNQLVTTRNALAKELSTLDKALDTRLAPKSQATD
jgi:flagellar biosynthesis chaperone FliJ